MTKYDTRLQNQNERLKSQVEALKGRVGELLGRLRSTQDNQAEALNDRVEALKGRVGELLERLRSTQDNYAAAREYFRLYRQGIFASSIAKVGDVLKADCYISLLPSTLPAAFELRRQFGGIVVCDNVENVDVDKHSASPDGSPTAIRMVNHAAHGALYDCDKLLTVGDALSRTLQRFGRPCFVLRNFRSFEEPQANDSLRTACGLSSEKIILFASGNVVVGFEPVLEALYELPDTFHLVALVRFAPSEYGEHVHKRIRELNLQERVHLLPFVPYERLAATAAAADIGLITSDISNPNGAVGLPNRCFDYLTAGLPIVSPAMPDVKALVDLHGFGRILDETTREQWKANILKVAEDIEHYRDRAHAARKILTWESQEEQVYDFLGRPKSVTLLGFRDLTRYQRYIRLAKSLRKFGCSVKLAFYSEDPDTTSLPEDMEFYCTGERYVSVEGPRRIRTTGSCQHQGEQDVA
jgi:glycosyltransferase involved in cell wall biosynthesis